MIDDLGGPVVTPPEERDPVAAVLLVVLVFAGLAAVCAVLPDARDAALRYMGVLP